MRKTILEIFNLQDSGIFLRECDVFEEELILRIRESNHAECPRCNKITRGRHAIGKWRKIYHGYGFGRKVYLLVRKDRYLCSRCEKTFTETLPIVLPRQRKKIKAEDQILEALRGQSFKSLAEKEGVSYGVARRVLQRRLNPEELIWKQENEDEFSLGIDSHSFGYPTC